MRASIAIASATAGANAEKAALSYDDNESTAWSNDGKLSTAWIEYKLAEPSTPTQLDIKLNAFRTRRYPLRITLDGTMRAGAKLGHSAPRERCALAA
jgi:beta-galactosidase